MTPEGRIKAAVKRALAPYKIYQFWPVPNGYGPSTLDCVLCVNGHFIAVETKAPGKDLTPRQQLYVRQILAAGGSVVIIDDANHVFKITTLIERVLHAPNQYTPLSLPAA